MARRCKKCRPVSKIKGATYLNERWYKMDEKVSPDEATRFVEAILNLKREQIITKEEARDALTRILYFSDIVKHV